MHTIVGTFRSGKTTRLVEIVQDGEHASAAAVIVPNKALKMQFIKLLEPGSQITVLTLDSFVGLCMPRQYGSRQALHDAFCNDIGIPKYVSERLKPWALCVDDADRISENVLNRIKSIATSQKLKCVITGRTRFPDATSTEILSSPVGLLTDHRLFLTAVYKDTSVQCPRGEPIVYSHEPFRNDINLSDTAARLAPHFMHPDTVVLCENIRIGTAIELAAQQNWKGTVRNYMCCSHKMSELIEDIVICRADAFYGLARSRVVVIPDNMSEVELLEALTRSTDCMVIDFCASSPPAAFVKARSVVSAMVEPGGPFINWECVGKQRPKKRTHTEAFPLSISKTAAKLVTEHPDSYLTKAAELWNWGSLPTVTTLAEHRMHRVPSMVEQFGLSACAGHAAELVFLRELYMNVEGAGIGIAPDDCQRYYDSTVCNDPTFLQAWAATAPHTQTKTLNEFMDMFKHPKWGGDHELALVVATSLTKQKTLPYVLLPTAAKTNEIINHVKKAEREFMDLSRPMSERSYWILGCMANMLHDYRYYSLAMVCNDRRWEESADESRKSFFADVSERMRHLIQVVGVSHVSCEVPVQFPNGTSGRADFDTDEAIIELKLSTKRWDDAWTLQGACYAHFLKRPCAHIYNALNGMHKKIEFNPNLFY